MIIRQLVSRLGEKLEFSRFLNDWMMYLDDIVFIAQNTQTVVGANLNLRDYQLLLDKHQRETIRMLSSVTDLLVHITSPSDVFFRDVRGRDIAYNLRQKLDALFGVELAPRLAYHKLLEVRGLLSNLINNTLIDVLKSQKYEPFLFFPEGVIYLAPQNTQSHVDLAPLTKAAWDPIAKLLAGGQQVKEDSDEEEGDEEGLKMKRTKDYMKVPQVLYELLSLEALVEVVAKLRCLFATLKLLHVSEPSKQMSVNWILRDLARRKRKRFLLRLDSIGLKSRRSLQMCGLIS